MINNIKFNYIAAIMAAIGFYLGFMGGAVQLKHQNDITRACNASHAVIDGKLEQQCGYLQDKYHMEYLCNSPDKNATCWTETK